MAQQTPHTTRYIDENTSQDKLYEVTLNTVQDRFFFIPSKLLNLIILGVLAHSQKKTRLRLCYVTFMSNHAHLLIRTSNAKQVADFFCLANSQIAKEVQRFVDWTGSVFTPSYTLIAVTDEPEAQEARLRYLMSQGVKEGLCPHPTKWPGIQSASALISGSMQLMGKWIHRTAFSDLQHIYQRTAALKAANRKRNQKLEPALRKRFRGKKRRKPKINDHAEYIPLELSPLPCWDGLSKSEVSERSSAMAKSIVEEHQAKIKSLPPNWRKRLTEKRRATERPRKRRSRGVRPKVHAASEEEWVVWMKTWEGWMTRFESASHRLRQGVKEALAEFPPGAFVPTGCYLGALEDRAPP